MAEGDQQPDEELVRLMCDKGFKTFGFPLVSNAVKCVFPFRSYLSVIIAIFRVYPLMGEFVKVRGLPAHGGIHQGEGSTHSWENSSRKGVYPLIGKFVKERGLPTHGRIRQGKGSTRSWENSSR